jgi:hypothetical protein
LKIDTASTPPIDPTGSKWFLFRNREISFVGYFMTVAGLIPAAKIYEGWA